MFRRTYSRTTELRRLCETLRQHISNLQKHSAAQVLTTGVQNTNQYGKFRSNICIECVIKPCGKLRALAAMMVMNGLLDTIFMRLFAKQVASNLTGA